MGQRFHQNTQKAELLVAGAPYRGAMLGPLPGGGA